MPAPLRPVPAATGRPRSPAAHAAILTAAIALIREEGFDAVTMEGIAARAGVGKATVYRRWRAKELLVAEAIGQLVRAIPVPDTGRVKDDVLTLMAATTAMYRDPASVALLSGLVAAMPRSAPVARAVRTGFVARWREVMSEVITRGAQRGELRADLDIPLVLDLLSGPAFYRYLMLGRPVNEQFTRDVVDVILRGLASSANAAAPTRTRRGRRGTR